MVSYCLWGKDTNQVNYPIRGRIIALSSLTRDRLTCSFDLVKEVIEQKMCGRRFLKVPTEMISKYE